METRLTPASAKAANRPVSTEPGAYAPVRLTARPRSNLFVGKDEMRAAIGDAATCSLNALSPDLHAGTNPRYGRPGRIPGSTNVPAATLFDPVTRELRPADHVRLLRREPDEAVEELRAKIDYWRDWLPDAAEVF